MRILTTGSREWADWKTIWRVLNGICVEFDLNFDPDEYGNTMPDDRKFAIIHGDCPKGADHWVDQWCIGNFFIPERHPANWETFGKRAGFVRNAEMVDLGADLCLAFVKNKSKGATHTANLAMRAGIETRWYTDGNL